VHLVGLTHPVPAALAITAFTARNDLIRGNPVSYCKAFRTQMRHILSHFYDMAQEFMAGDKRHLNVARLHTVTPEHCRAMLAFQISGANTAAFHLDDDVIVSAYRAWVAGSKR